MAHIHLPQGIPGILGPMAFRLLQQLPQSYLLFWTDNEFSLLRTSSWIRHDPRDNPSSLFMQSIYDS
jgi:hypothetical protein